MPFFVFVFFLFFNLFSGSPHILDKVLKIHFTIPNINYKDKKTGSTALIWTSRVGNVEILKRLIKQQADINATDNNGMSALIFAADAGNPQIVRELVKHKNLGMLIFEKVNSN